MSIRFESLQPLPAADSRYIPGTCNIGPAEIRTRRRFGHLALVITIGLWAALAVYGVPAPVRFVVALPAAGAAEGYLQAFFHFCAGFAARGVFNFGDKVGQVTEVLDAEARRLDRRHSMRINLASLAIGVAVGILAILLPF